MLNPSDTTVVAPPTNPKLVKTVLKLVNAPITLGIIVRALIIIV